jgi:membrane protein DedA with SNARE-associated domain
MEWNQLQQLIEHYGYLAVFVGALLEGETILIMAGFLAHAGYLNLVGVVAIAAFGGFLGDQFFFALGRVRGRRILERFPRIRAQAARVDALVRRYQNYLIVGIRFMYGLRVAGPVLLGMSEVSHMRFALVNLVGAMIWATLIGGAGFLFGQAVEMFFQDAKRYEVAMLGALLLTGIGVWIYRRHRLGARTKQQQDARW